MSDEKGTIALAEGQVTEVDCGKRNGTVLITALLGGFHVHGLTIHPTEVGSVALITSKKSGRTEGYIGGHHTTEAFARDYVAFLTEVC